MTEIPSLASFLAQQADFFGTKDILTVPEDCWTYGYDNSRRHVLHQTVVFPITHEQVVIVVSASSRFNVLKQTHR